MEQRDVGGGHIRAPGAIPDGRGPRVTATNPPNGAPSVDPRKRIRVWFGEGVAPASIGDSTIGPSLVTLVVREDPGQPGTGMLVQETQPPISTEFQRVIREGVASYLPDIDNEETNEWIESFDGLLERSGAGLRPEPRGADVARQGRREQAIAQAVEMTGDGAVALLGLDAHRFGERQRRP